MENDNIYIKSILNKNKLIWMNSNKTWNITFKTIKISKDNKSEYTHTMHLKNVNQ